MVKIIAFEGLDLTGKSELTRTLNIVLRGRGLKSKTNKGTLTAKGIFSQEEEKMMSGFEKDLYYTILFFHSQRKSTPSLITTQHKLIKSYLNVV